jgi:cytochrome c oxidase assembly protein subunit 15
MLHRFAVFVACATLVLITAGGMVTSTGSGLAVPDWPNSYGYFMFTFPLSSMVGGIFYEHGHRLIASTVGLLTIVLAAWLWWRDPRPWLRRLGFLALGAVIVQGTLGGITVLWFLPAPISIAHAGLSQIFFCLVASIALFTSPGWLRGYGRAPGAPGVEDARLRWLAVVTTALVYIQILAGATMRHTGAGLAIPDFPLAFGRLLPPVWTPAIAIHFAHRAGAAIVLAAASAVVGRVWYHRRRQRELWRPALCLILLVCTQITLGGLTVLSGRAPIINTAHVTTGALVLATSLVLSLRAWRVRFATVAVPVRADRRVPMPAPSAEVRA